ncbi:type I polyketide synthase [Acidicapsa ligni]|uniref:type I polyketide synthase n=1 Tax=Acidicapsa ligni TaxID=542300 RepID=UPI0021E0D1BF|nr:type I polyketide synthase [Acidicapsa ligni]
MKAAENSNSEPIAIIGMSCRLPGASSPEALWLSIVEKRDNLADYPGGRSPELDAYYAQPGVPNFASTARGGFLPDLDKFDASFFEISPREAQWTDPQQRLLLEVSWEAMEDAGLRREQLAGSKAGVYIGVWASDYERHSGANAPSIDFFHLAGGPLYGASSRISYQFDLRGPDASVNAACASSLVAIHMAVRALRAGECSVALAGGTNLIFRQELTQALASANVLSKDGRCKFGDASADGFVRSEGIGVLVCKRLSDAERDGDRILGLIRGTAVTNNGQVTGSMSSPSEEGQRQAMLDAVADAQLDPASIDYVEAHGTGTRAGDPVELAAIASVFGKQTGRSSIVRVGSVKSNIGHTESTAGIASIVKTIQAFQHRFFPPTIHAHELNPAVDWDNNGLMLEREGTQWEANFKSPRRASVNGLGLTGTNAHVVLEEAPPSVPINTASRAAYLLPISASSDAALLERARDIANRLEQSDLNGDSVSPCSIADLCFTAAVRRTHLSHRLAVTGTTSEELQGSLRAFASGQESRLSASGIAKQNNLPKVAFVFPGQGSQWIGMGRELLQSEPEFRHAIEACDLEIQKETGWSLLDQLQNPAREDQLARIDTIQPTLFAMEVALAELWKSWGITPHAVVGHSMGEVAAAHIAGILSLTDAVKIICRRSALLMRVAGSGAMVVVDLTRVEAEQAIAGLEDRISIAVSNSPRSTVLAGDPKALDGLVQRLEAQEIFCRWVRVDVASHSPQMDPLKDDLSEALRDIEPSSALVPMYSTVKAIVIDGGAGKQMDAAYWVSNLRETVQFAATVEMLIEQGFDAFIEMSPHPILIPFVEQTAEHVGRQVLAIGSLRREERETETLLLSLGRLYTHGFEVDWKRLYPVGNQVSLPAYPWQRERFWIESSNAKRSLMPGSGHPLIGEALHSAAGQYIWTPTLTADNHPWLKDHGVDGSILLPASAYVEMAQAVQQRVFATAARGIASTASIEHLRLDQAIILTANSEMLLQLIASPQSDGSFHLEFFTRTEESAEWNRAAEARLRQSVQTVAETVNLSAWEDAELSPESISGQRYAESFARFGYEFGPSFRQHEWATLLKSAGLAAIRVPQGLNVNGYHLHPATLDAALQLLASVLFENSQTDTALLPVEFDHIEFFPSIERSSVFYVRVLVESVGLLKGDVAIYDAQGHMRVRILGLEFKPLASTSADQLEAMMFTMDWEPLSDLRTGSKQASGSWLLIADHADHKNVADQLANALRQADVAVQIVSRAEVLKSEELLADNLSGVVFLASLELTASSSLAQAEEIHLHVVQVVQRLSDANEASTKGGEENTRFWTVTRSAQSIRGEFIASPLASGIWGLIASVQNEYPELHASCIDLPVEITPAEISRLAETLIGNPEEDRILLRANASYAARMTQWSADDSNASIFTITGDETSEDFKFPGSANSFELIQRSRSLLESFELRSTIHPDPGPDEVEIAVEAGGLNFLDVLRGMGINDALSGSHFGGECSGIILRVGANITAFQAGDAVIAISPSFQDATLFASCVNIPAALVVRKPQSMSFDQSAGLPCVFLTAYYALVKLAQVKRGEEVLIHAAAGGVGLAAIQVAQWLGAEVYATVGSDEKRAYIASLGVKHIMSSRTLDFRNEVLAKTNGEGVDVVLNSLAGPAIAAGLESLAPYGRFIEIGKRDIWENSKIGLNPFLRNRSFFAVDLAKSVEDRRAMVGELFGEVIALFEQGIFRALPVTVFPISQAGEAFRIMAQGKHMGKIILSMRGSDAQVHLDASRISFNATYLITGGLGGLGLVAAEALVARGARQLVLVSRREPSVEAQVILDKLESQGATILVRSHDLTSSKNVEELFAEIRSSRPPLRGIIHAAGVLDDAVVQHLTAEKFATVMDGKVGGALAIDKNIVPGELDFLIYHSSAAGILGTPGQANYAAANAMLDGLAHQQRSRGIPAISIDWGSWAEVGLAALQQNRGARLTSHGLTPLTPAEGSELLFRILAEAPTQVAAMRFDANAWCDSNPIARRSRVFSALLNEARSTASKTIDIAEQFRWLSSDALRAALTSWVREQVSTVLRCEIERVAQDKALRSLGLDSLMALELRNRLERGLHLKLSATLAWNYPTVVALAAHLETKLASGTPGSALASALAKSETIDSAALPQENLSSIKIFEEASTHATPVRSHVDPSAAELLEAELMGVQSLLHK